MGRSGRGRGARRARRGAPAIDYGTFPDLPPTAQLREIPGRVRRARSTVFGELLRRQRRWLVLFLVVILVSSTSAIAVASATRALVDQGIVQQSAHLDVLFRNAVVAATYFAVMNFLWQRVLARLVYQLDFDLRTWLFTRLQSADVRNLDAFTSGQVVSRAFTDVRLVEAAMQALPLAVAATPAIFGLALFLMFQNPVIGLLAAASVPINLLLVTLFRVRLRALSWAELNERAEVAAAIDEPVRGIRVVQAFDRAPDERRRVAYVALRVYRYAMSRVRLLARYDFFLKSAPVAVNALVLGFGIMLAADGRLTLGTLLLSFQLVTFGTQFASGFDAFASAWQYLVAAQGRLNELLVLGRAPRVHAAELADDSGLQLLGVTVTFGDRTVLDDLHLAVSPGELVVLRGAPGSGKTTIASVAAGVLVPDSGSASVAGVDVRLLGVDQARDAVLVASEVPFIFAGTLRENLDLALDAPATDDELRAALYAAGAEDVVDVLPGGLDAVVGDRGLTLSGGQRQRVALARSLLRPPRVLILDDALSAVNPAREVEILQRIRRHAPTTAILCITRRRGPTTIADRIVDLPEPELVVDAAAPATAPAIERPPDAALGPRHLAVLRSLRMRDETPVYPEDEVSTAAPLTLRAVTRPYKVLVTVTLLSLVGLTILRLAPDFIIGNAADLVDRDDATTQGWLRAGAIVLVGIGVGAGAYLFRILVQRYAQSIMYLLRRRVFHRLSSLGIDYFDRELPGNVAARIIYDLDTISEFIQSTSFFAAVVVMQAVVALLAMLLISPVVTPAVIAGFVIMALLSVVLVPRIERAVAVQRTRVGEVTARFEEDFLGRRDVRLFGATRKRVRAFTDTAWSLRRAQSRVATLQLSYSTLMSLTASIVTSAVLVLAGNDVLALELSVGAALTLNLLAQNAITPLGTIGHLYSAFLRARVSWRELRQPFAEPILPVLAASPEPVGTLTGQITFEDAHFTYPHTTQPVLHGIDLTIEAGTAVALVGYTGAGKSSITKLLMRMYDPTHGRVLVDGRDLRDLDLAAYRRSIGVVPQDAFLFRGTVHSNIAYGRPDATPEEVQAAAREVGAYDVLGALEGGFDHEVQEEGRNLTGAQQQLIALARAWLARPAIMILDEATSALDAALERSVLKAVTRLGCTTLMVTHRESVVAAAQRILVLDAGRIVEDGTPARVVGAGGPYDRLWVAEPVVALEGSAG